jgi:hypothetical protein
MAFRACGAHWEIPLEDRRLTINKGQTATIGVAEHGNSAILVTLAPGGRILDRRRIDLTTGLPTHPYHHEGSWAVGRYLNSSWAKPISLTAAVTLIERVHVAAAHGAQQGLAAQATIIPMTVSGISIRACARLPASIEERISDTRANALADSIMYREALALAAMARGWTVHWYEREKVFQEARTVLGGDDLDVFLRAMGRTIGPPWQAKHKLAAAAALAVGPRR